MSGGTPVYQLKYADDFVLISPNRSHLTESAKQMKRYAADFALTSNHEILRDGSQRAKEVRIQSSRIN